MAYHLSTTILIYTQMQVSFNSQYHVCCIRAQGMHLNITAKSCLHVSCLESVHSDLSQLDAYGHYMHPYGHHPLLRAVMLLLQASDQGVAGRKYS